MNKVKKLEKLANKVLNQVGLKAGLSRYYRHGWIVPVDSTCDLWLNVGSGPDRREGYINCDIRAMSGVSLVCVGWEVSKYCKQLGKIFSRHTLEHFSDAEARLALLDWYDALKVGGEVEIIVPNMDFHIEQWRQADWNNEKTERTEGQSNENWAFAGFYGWQRECDPKKPNYNSTYWDVHKSGYSAKRLECLLANAGFVEIETEIIDECHLVARAKKITIKGERQVAPTLDGIRRDHLERYKFASQIISRLHSEDLADLACGTGYGSYYLSKNAGVKSILAGDLDEGAITYGKSFFNSDKITYKKIDLVQDDLDQETYDCITSFETLEHVPNPELIVKKLADALKPGGVLVASSPNEEVMPFNREWFPFHLCHFTPEQFEKLFVSNGLVIEDRKCQMDSDVGDIVDGWAGRFNIAVCRKPRSS